MNILILTPAMNIGGEELSMLNFSEKLMESGHEVFWGSSTGDLESRIVEKGIKVIKNEILNNRKLFGLYRGSKVINNWVNENRIQIIHSNQFFPTFMCGIAKKAWWGERKNIKIIFDSHGQSSITYLIIGLLFPFLIDKIIAVSKFEASRLKKNFCPKSLIETIYPGIDISRYMKINQDEQLPSELTEIVKNDTVIGCVGRLTWEKGQEYLIRSLKYLNDYKITVLIVGDGEKAPYLKKLAYDIGVGDKVKFLGFRDDVEQLMQIMDIIVIPSVSRITLSDLIGEFTHNQNSNILISSLRFINEYLLNWVEAFGLVCLEAKASKKTIIASQVGGLVEQIDNGTTGFLIPCRNPVLLANKIQFVINEPNISKKCAKNAQNDAAENFDISKNSKKIVSLYSSLLE